MKVWEVVCVDSYVNLFSRVHDVERLDESGESINQFWKRERVCLCVCVCAYCPWWSCWDLEKSVSFQWRLIPIRSWLKWSFWDKISCVNHWYSWRECYRFVMKAWVLSKFIRLLYSCFTFFVNRLIL